MTKAALKKMIEARIEAEREDLRIHELIKVALAPHNGGILSGKVQKAILKSLPSGYVVKLQYGMWYIVDDRQVDHLVKYDNEFLDSEKFDERDSASCSGSKDRIEKLEHFLNDPFRLETMHKAFARIKTAWQDFGAACRGLEEHKVSNTNPMYYELLKANGVPSKAVFKVIFDKEF